nr:GAF domain-containing protein [Cesiribacter andamanensis]
MVGENRQWFKSRQGTELTESPRDYSFCAHAILNPEETMVVPDARYDERFHDNPLTTGDPQVVFYAGVPVQDDQGHALGTLCVIDSRPREISEQKIASLQALAKLVNAHFELRKTKEKYSQLQHKMVQARQLVYSLSDTLEHDDATTTVPPLEREQLTHTVEKLRETFERY